MKIKPPPQKKHKKTSDIVKKFNVDNFQYTKVLHNFHRKLPDVLAEQLPSPTEDNWEQLKNVIITSCKDTLGFKTERNQDWVDGND